MTPADGSHCWGSGVSDFRVVLPKRVYVPGEFVRGTLHLSTDAPVKCRGLHARLEHKSLVHWHTGNSGSKNSNRKDYHGEEARNTCVCAVAVLTKHAPGRMASAAVRA